jgi:hypothetical protein
MLRVAPSESVKPDKTAPSANATHRMASRARIALGAWCPRIRVTAGPFTLRTIMGFVTATRFVSTPLNVRPPVW